MKEKVIFWLITAIFILSCALVFVLCNNSRNYSPVVFAETSVSTQAAFTDAPEETSSQAALLNINSATKEELMALKGIGEVIAGRIIDYREKNGDFYSIEELMEVSGISEAKFNAIKNLITI